MACKVCETYPQSRFYDPKPPTGHKSILFVGEQPTATDIFMKTPYESQAGTLFSVILSKIGIDIADTYFTYACRCRAEIGVTPTEAMADECRDHLDAIINTVKPTIIVAMGPLAHYATVGEKCVITTTRGKVQWSKRYETTVLTTYSHFTPSRQTKTFEDFTRDLEKIPDLLKNPLEYQSAINLSTKWWLIDTLEKGVKAVDFLVQQAYIACDTETTGLSAITNKAFTYGFCWQEGLAVLIDETLIESTEFYPHLKRLFEAAGPKWIWQNGKFDVQFLRHRGIRARVDEDTMLKHYCIDERKGTHGLETMAVQYLGAPDYKSEFRRVVDGEEDYSRAPREKLLVYLAHDVDYTFRINFILQKKLELEGCCENAYRQILIPASNTFADMELTGIKTDLKYLEKLSEEYHEKIDNLRTTLQDAAAIAGWDADKYVVWSGAKKRPAEFNPGSTKQLGYVVFECLHLPTYRGSRSTDKKAIKYWQKRLGMPKDEDAAKAWAAEAGKNDPRVAFMYALLEHRKVTKLCSTYIDGLIEATEVDGRVHATFLLHGTTTGRLASRGPNMQNMPRGPVIKTAFVPEQDNIYIQADYSQCIVENTCVNDQCMIQNHQSAVFKGTAFTYRLKTRLNYEVEGTSDHKVLTNYGWLPMSSLRADMWVALQGEEPTDEFIPQDWLLGRIIGNNNPMTLDKINRLLMPDIDNLTNKTKALLTARAMFDTGERFIPYEHVSSIRSFMAGLLDGCSVNITPGLGNSHIRIQVLHEKLAKDIHQTLLRFGVMSAFANIKASRKKGQWHIRVSDIVSIENFLKIPFRRDSTRVRTKALLVSKRILVEKGAGINKLPIPQVAFEGHPYLGKATTFARGHAYSRWAVLDSGMRSDIIDEYLRYHWDKVDTCVATGEVKPVYDLMDQPENRFCAGGIIVHNCELRVLAVLSGDPALQQIYRDGKDLHDEVSVQIFGPNFTKEQRVRAKAFNFGLAYGRTPQSIAEDYGFPVAEAVDMQNKWFERFPIAAQYIQYARSTPAAGIVQSTPFGRKRRFGLVTNENAWNLENEAVNFPVQSTAADLATLSVVKMHAIFPVKFVVYTPKLLVPVHDSILVEARKGQENEVIPVMLDIMQSIPGKLLNTDMPFIADAEVGMSWGKLTKWHEPE